MRWAFRVLGLSHDADERAVKRAYAAKLKLTRPDEDPEGFQRLNEAYRAALAQAQRRAGLDKDEDEDEDDAFDGDASDLAEAEALHIDASTPREESHGTAPPPLPPAVATDVHEVDAQTTDADALNRLLDACLEAARLGDPRELERWLRGRPELWSLERKAAIGHWLLRLVSARRPPMPERNFDLIANFFGYNDLGAGFDALMLRQLRAQSDDAWRQWQSEQRQQRRFEAQAQAQAQMSDPKPRVSGQPLPPSAFSFESYARKTGSRSPGSGEIDWNDLMSRPDRREAPPPRRDEGALVPRWLVFVLILLLVRCAGMLRDHGGGLPSDGNSLRNQAAPLAMERGIA